MLFDLLPESEIKYSVDILSMVIMCKTLCWRIIVFDRIPHERVLGHYYIEPEGILLKAAYGSITRMCNWS